MTCRFAQKGVSTVIVLLVLSIILVIVFAICAQGIWNMNYINTERARKISFNAAEAGIHEAMLRYKNKDSDYTWMQGVGSRTNPQRLSNGGYYYAEVLRAGLKLPNGELVPPGMICFVGTGSIEPFRGTRVDPYREKQAAVTMTLVSNYNFALSSAGDVTVKNTDIWGSVKTAGTLYQSSGVTVHPEEVRDTTGTVVAWGDGRVLATKFVDNGAKQIVIAPDTDPNTLQDVRARGDDGSRPDPQNYSDGITGQMKVYNADPMVPNSGAGQKNDVTIDTLTWIPDAATDPEAPKEGQYGERLPNPDPLVIMAQVSSTGHTYRNSTKSTFTCSSQGITSLSAGVYYFPDGVTVDCPITGNVTIITGKSNGQVIHSVNPLTGTTYTDTEGASVPGTITYNTNVPRDACNVPIYQVNLLALDGGSGIGPAWTGSGTKGGSTISFSNDCVNKGLIYSHGSVTTQGQFTNYGTVISFRGDQSHLGAGSNFIYDRKICQNCLGFADWFQVSRVNFDKHVVSFRRY